MPPRRRTNSAAAIKQMAYRAGFWRGLLWGTLVGLILNMLIVKIAAAQHQQTLTFQQLASDVGLTICYKQQPYSYVRVELLEDSVQLRATLAHERTHVEQMARFANDCDRFIAWYKTPVGKLMSEAEAFMTDLCVAVSLGADKITLRHDYANRLAHYLGGDINALTINEAMNRYDTCPLVASDVVDTSRTQLPGWR